MRWVARVCATAAIAIVLAYGPNDLAPSAAPEVLAAQDSSAGRSGCCSWHGGVCGCSNGRAKCCDGTLSPSCDCD